MKARKVIRKIGGALVSVIVSYLLIMIFAPGFKVPGQAFPKRKRKDKAPPDTREDVSFVVNGLRVRGWLYRPQTDQRVPCIILSTGLGGTKDRLLERYALRFVAGGYAALVYDYRYFGTSEGEPRQLVDTTDQLDDLRAAIAFIRERPEIDPDNIFLWGTSAAGGYGIIVAGEDPRLAGVITQCAALDREADAENFFKQTGVLLFMRLFMHAQRDKGRSRFGLAPHRIPIVGRPGTVAFLTAPGAYDGYARVVAESATFENQVCARLLFMGHGPAVAAAAEKVQCPGLILVCAQDNLVAADSHARVAAALGDKATVVSYPIGHFDIYEGEYLENAVEAKLTFVARHAKLPTMPESS